MLYREIPFLRIGIPLCAGIIMGLYYKPGNIFFLSSAILILILFIVNYFLKDTFSGLFYGFTLTTALFLLGLFLYTKEKNEISMLDPYPGIFSGTISEFPEEKANTFRIIIKLNSKIESQRSAPVRGSIMLYHRKNSEMLSYLPGDRIVIRCTPLVIANRGNPFEFNYRFYMENQGIRYYSFTDSTDILGYSIPEKRSLVHRALIIRMNIIDMFRQRGICGDRLALVAAITLGQKNMLDSEQKQYFMKAGVMHIMAVSGLHAVILSMFVFNVLFFLKGRLNILRVIITILILWLFAFVTGLTPSVLRATLMFTFLHAGRLMRRPVNGINSVLASAFVLILLKPSVVFDAGFLLSYCAVIYIICFYHDLYLKLSLKRRLPDLIWQSAAVSIIAQLGTLPLTVMLFNRFPVWFILSNVIIVPLSSLVVIIGCIVPLTFPVFFLSKFLAGILSFLAGLTEQLTRIASTLPLATIENIGITTLECILLTLTIFLFTSLLLKKETISVIFPLSTLLCLILTGFFKDISNKRSCELIVYNAVDRPVIGLRTGKILSVYSDTGQTGQEVTRHFATLHLKKRSTKLGRSPVMIRTEDNNILITSTLNQSILQYSSPDFVIITGRKPVVDRNILTSAWHFKAIIFTSESDDISKASHRLSSKDADTVHIISKNGAYIRKL